MTLQIHLGPELEAKLRERAAAAGKEAEAFALEALVEKILGPRTLAEILAPIHEEVRQSGMSAAELDALLGTALAKSRLQRRNKA